MTAVLRVTGPGFVLADAATQEHRVDTWGRVLAGVCQQPAIVRVQLLSRAVPSGLTTSRRWWREHTGSARGPVAAALADLFDEGFVTPTRRETLLAVAVRLPRAARRSPGLDDIAGQLQAIASALPGADLTAVGWLDRDHLARVLRSGYEPFAAARTEDAPTTPTAAPGAREQWASLTIGTALHATYWVSEWPRSATHPGFLQPLLLGDVGTRTFTLIAEPLATTRALREIRRAKVEHASDAAQRHRIGQVEDEATRAEVADLERREAELVAGHGDLRFTGLVTVSATEPDRARRPVRRAGDRRGAGDVRGASPRRTAGRRLPGRRPPARAGCAVTARLPHPAGPLLGRSGAAAAGPPRLDCGARRRLPVPRPGHRSTQGVPVGTDLFTGGVFCFDPWTQYADGDLTNPNVLLAGVIGQGKSALAKSLALRSIAAGRRVYVPGDPEGRVGRGRRGRRRQRAAARPGVGHPAEPARRRRRGPAPGPVAAAGGDRRRHPTTRR